MWVALTNRNARVLRAAPEERAWLRDYLAFPDPAARWKGREGPKALHHLYEEVSETFPSGFAPSVVKAGAEAGHKVELVDQRVRPVERDPDANLLWLRPYQREAVDRCCARGRGVLWHVTGSGKAEVAVGLTRALPCPWLMLAPNLSLVHNLAERFLKRNREHGVDLGEPGRIGEGKWSEGEHLTVATYQSIYEHLDDPRCAALLDRVGGLLCDESHVVPSVTFLEATRACGAYYRIGTSGTPLQRGDMKSALAIAALGPIIHRYSAQEAVANGDISRARVRMATVRHPLPDGYVFAEVYRELVVESRARNAVLVDMARRCDKPALLFVREIEHGRALERGLAAAGVPCAFVWGTHSAEQQRRHLAALVRGDTQVVVTSAVLKQGVSVDALRTILMGAGGKSTIDVLQKLGRGSRVERGAKGEVTKGEFTLLDVYDTGNDWLEAHSKARKRAYLSEGYEVVVEPERARAYAARRDQAE